MRKDYSKWKTRVQTDSHNPTGSCVNVHIKVLTHSFQRGNTEMRLEMFTSWSFSQQLNAKSINRRTLNALERFPLLKSGIDKAHYVLRIC